MIRVEPVLEVAVANSVDAGKEFNRGAGDIELRNLAGKFPAFDAD